MRTDTLRQRTQRGALQKGILNELSASTVSAGYSAMKALSRLVFRSSDSRLWTTSKRQISVASITAQASAQAASSEPAELESKESIKKILDDLAFKRWNFRSLEDWHKRRAEDVSRANPGLLRPYEGSLLRALTDIYPEHPFKFWKFKEVPLRFWRVRKNQRDFFEDLAASKGYTSLEGFYSTSRNEIVDHGGHGLMEIFGNSVSAAIMSAYPEHKWQLFRFEIVPKSYWDNKANVTEYLSWLQNKLGLISLDDWYKVTRRDFVDTGGAKLIAMSKDSVSQLLKKFYPKHNWDDAKFQNIPMVFENDKVNKVEFLRAIEDKFQIKTPEDWYRISMAQLYESGGRFVFPNRTGLLSELKALYPFFQWDETLFNGYFGRTSHWWLKQVLADLFPGEELLEEHRLKELVVLDRSRVIPKSLDIFLPGLKLAFEFQGDPQNYNPESRLELDKTKKEACASVGIALIGVPFWWKKDQGRLIRAIISARPDLNDRLIARPETVNYLLKLHSLRQPPSPGQEEQ